MKPDYKKAAEKAVETISRFNLAPECADPIFALKKIPNVLLVPYETSQSCDSLCGDNQDAFTLVNTDHGKLQFIIIYNQSFPETQLQFALARELGHVILQHNGNDSEYIWSEEANCFAYHFLCPLPLLKKKSKPINYRPKHDSLLWEMKSILAFNSMDDMKTYIAKERNKYNHYIGIRDVHYSPVDIQLINQCEYDTLTGWKNCYDIVLDGTVVGCCGE